ncbi:Biotin transporter BioY [Planctomycetes bacterium Poly30]|uniref:Biotin transporter n=1 Tax=Saltatorellus ferox TaxID=2528018 RepID=A0A518EMV9_9BACT|nr:Biotin transporter BioY [Planctomycetes bacterium Poly30]
MASNSLGRSRERGSNPAWAAIWILVGAISIALGARVNVSLEPVPMTLQTLAVLAVGGLLGARIGAGAAAAYLALVLLGAPILSNGDAAPGRAFLELKTAGYVVGFVPAAFLSGFAGRGVLFSLMVMATAHALILALGAAWLARFVGLSAAIEYGVTPFLWGALIKTVVAAALTEHFAQRKTP